VAAPDGGAEGLAQALAVRAGASDRGGVEQAFERGGGDLDDVMAPVILLLDPGPG